MSTTEETRRNIRQLYEATRQLSLPQRAGVAARFGVDFEDLSGASRSQKVHELIVFLTRTSRQAELEQELDRLAALPSGRTKVTDVATPAGAINERDFEVICVLLELDPQKYGGSIWAGFADSIGFVGRRGRLGELEAALRTIGGWHQNETSD
jgi:hypothetical protein